jgi:hypothetical protein
LMRTFSLKTFMILILEMSSKMLKKLLIRLDKKARWKTL